MEDGSRMRWEWYEGLLVEGEQCMIRVAQHGTLALQMILCLHLQAHYKLIV